MAESIYTDPRYEALGMTDTTQQRAADQFYGSVPQFNPIGGYGGMDEFSSGYDYMDEDDLRTAYENDIISRMSQIDPSGPDYEYRLQEFFATLPDRDAVNYPRVKLAASALAGRARALKEADSQQIQEERKLRAQLAESGFDPAQFVNLMDENGRFDTERAYYELGKIKRGLQPSNETKLSASDEKLLLERFEGLPDREPTVEEKQEAFRAQNGRLPKTEEEWTSAYHLAENAIYGQARETINMIEGLGKTVPDYYKRRARMPLASQQAQAEATQTQVESTPETQSTQPQVETTSTQVTETVVDPNSPNLTLGEARAAREARAEQEQQNALNQQWTLGKQSLENNLLAALGGDRTKLMQLYRSVISDETVRDVEGAGEEWTRAQDDPDRMTSQAERTLQQMGLQPDDPSPDLRLDRGFFRGSFVTNKELLRALAEDRLSTPSQAVTEAPIVNSPEELDAAGVPIGGTFRVNVGGRLETKIRQR